MTHALDSVFHALYCQDNGNGTNLTAGSPFYLVDPAGSSLAPIYFFASDNDPITPSQFNTLHTEVFDTLHLGPPDYNSGMIANSCEHAFEYWCEVDAVTSERVCDEASDWLWSYLATGP